MEFLPLRGKGMHILNHSNRLHHTLLYAAYGWLLLSGLLQIGIDVVSQYLRGKRAPSTSTTLYYGLNSAYEHQPDIDLRCWRSSPFGRA